MHCQPYFLVQSYPGWGQQQRIKCQGLEWGSHKLVDQRVMNLVHTERVHLISCQYVTLRIGAEYAARMVARAW